MGFVVDRASGKGREAAPDDEVSILLMGADRWEEDPAFEEVDGGRLAAVDCSLRATSFSWKVEGSTGLSPEPPTVGLAVIAGVVLAFARSRAREYRLITQIRRMCASSLARNMRFYFR